MRFSVIERGGLVCVMDAELANGYSVMAIRADYPNANQHCSDYCVQLNNHFGGMPEEGQEVPLG